MDATTPAHPPEKRQIECDKTNAVAINEPINKIQTITDIQIEKMDITLTAIVSICNKPLKLLIDSGAQASMIKTKCLNSNVTYYPQIKYCMVGINGPKSAIQTHGATFGNIKINEIKIKQQFQLAGDDIHLAYDGILGMDFLCHYRAIIDLENAKLSILLPMNHNLYEFEERQMFEKSNSCIQKTQIKNKLLYLGDTENVYIRKPAGNFEIKTNKKIAKIDIQINRLETIQFKNETDKNEIEILPNCEKVFTIRTDIPMLAKGKTLDCGLHIADTIVSSERNMISVYNASSKIINLPALDVEMEPLGNYNIYKINDLAGFSDFHTQQECENRVEVILNSLDLSHCNKQELNIIKKLITSYHDIFHLEGDGLTFAKDGEHHMYTKPGTNPVNTKQYRIPHGQKPLVREKIAEMLRQGIIERSTSMWNSPILLVPKKSSTDKKEYRFCIDFKNVNKVCETRTFPMPNLEEELGKMYGSIYFSGLDIATAFHQMKLKLTDKEKTAFTAENQKYHFNRMPFGLAGSPITWQEYITNLLGELLNKHVMAYMDDILAHNPTLKSHVETLINIFDRLRASGLKLNLSKTKLFCKQIEYLGHIIDADGVKPSHKNIEAIQNVPTPKNVKEIQRFLGMASYFRKFISLFAKKAHPLNALCKKDVQFEWTSKCEEAFQSLKNALTTKPVLAFPDYTKKFYISTDASNYAVGGYISNDPPPHDKPIEYFSKTLNPAQKNYSTTHKELLAIILAIEQFRHFIWGKPFVLYTDHQALTYLFNQNKVGSRLLRWKLTLAEYDFEIIYRKGSHNTVSDCLSRIEPTVSVNVSHLITNTATKAIMQAITRSRSKESALIGNEKPKSPSFNIHEDPGVSFDTQKYEKILFMVDGAQNLSFKKLQTAIKQKIAITTMTPYKLCALNEHFTLMVVPKMNLNHETLAEKLKPFLFECQNIAAERIAINCSLSTFGAYRQLKLTIGEIFKTANIAVSLFSCTQLEITNVEEINEILKTYHTSILGGHKGVERMKSTIKKFFCWPSMNTDIKRYVENCTICEKTKINRHTHTPLQITSVANAPFEKIYIDFVGEINPNSSDGHKYIMTASCDLTKYVVMKATYDSTAITAAKTIVEEICLTFNFPKIIVSDNGPAFISETFRQMAKLLEIKHVKTCPYHPQSNGSIERYHRTLGQYIRAYTQKNPQSWHKFLPYFCFSYNTSVHTTTGFAPHTLIFGFDLEIPISVVKSRPSYNYDTYHNELLTNLREAHAKIKERIQERKMKNKALYDRRTQKAGLEVKRNDLVLLFNDAKKHKFANKYTGPYRVEEVVSPAVTKIRKNGKAIIIHNDKLKKSMADHGTATPPLLPDQTTT